MTEYWKSVGNYYCDYCKVFIRNDAFSRKQHEASPRHEGSLRRQVRDIHRNAEKEARDLAIANRELAKIGGKVALPTKPVNEELKKVNIGSRPKKVEKVATLDDQDVHRSALAAQAMPGQWSTTNREVTPEHATEHDEDKPDKHEIDWTEPTPDIEHDNSAVAVLKRRRDGADTDLIGFKVEAKRTVLENEDVPATDVPITFKQKKSRTDQDEAPVKFKKRRKQKTEEP